MAKPWHDINIPTFYHDPKDVLPAPQKINTGVDDSSEDEKKSLPVEYRIKWVKPVEPYGGFRINKPFMIEGEIEPLVETITRPRIKIHPVGIYKNKEDEFFPNGIDAFPDKNGRFQVTCDHLFVAINYDNDPEKPPDATWDLVICARGRTAEKESRSEPLSFPLPEKTFIELKKGYYDDNGSEKHRKPKDSEFYIPGDAVKRLQIDLIKLRYFNKGEDDGYFCEKTDSAVKEFQKISIDKFRFSLRQGKLIEVSQTLQKKEPDGIVDIATRDELDRWKKNGWVKPSVILRYGDYDDEGVRNHHGKEGGDDHHINTPVKELQEGLTELGFDPGKHDGWFHDKTKEAVIDFQNCALQKTRIVDEKSIEADITFTGAVNGIFDEPTRIEFDLWMEQRYHAPQISDNAMIFAAPGFNDGENGWFVIEENEIDSLIEEVNELDNLRVEIQKFRQSCNCEKLNESHSKNASELEQKITEKFKSLSENPSMAIQELLLVKSNSRWGTLSKRIYIRPYETKNGKVRGHFRRNNDTQVKKALQKWLKQDGTNGSSRMDAKLKAMIWNSDQIEESWPWKFKTLKGKKAGDTDYGHFEASYEAQFMRFAAGSNVNSDFDLRNMSIKLTASASASYSLAEGTVSGKWSLPDDNGFNMFDHLSLSNNAMDLVKNGVECRFRLTIEVSAKVFAGAAITGAVSLPCIDLSKTDKMNNGKNRTASAGVNADAFAGASVESRLISNIEWSKQSDRAFNKLAEIAAVASGNAGVGAAMKFEVKFENGKFRFESGVMAVFGVGGKCGGAFELCVNEGIDLLGHLFECVNFHRIDAVVTAAFETYVNVTFSQFIMLGKVGEKVIDNFKLWLTGLSGDSYRNQKKIIRKNLDDSGKFRKTPPEALGQLLQTIVKVPENDDFEAILKILQSADGRGDAGHRMKWIIRSFHDPGLSRIKELTDEMKKNALEEGIRELLAFGNGIDGQNDYQLNLRAILKSNGVKL